MKLAAVRRFALSLPETTEEPHFDLASFRVKGKIFATVPPDEKHLHVFVDGAVLDVLPGRAAEGVREAVLGQACRGPARDARRGEVGGRRGALAHAWRRRAPKKLAATLGEG